MFSGVEPRAVGSIMVLVALLGGIGFGGWSVLQEVQRVQFAPVEQTPDVVAEVDPLAGASRPEGPAVQTIAETVVPSPDALELPGAVLGEEPALYRFVMDGAAAPLCE